MAIWDDYFTDWDFIVSLFPSDWKQKFEEFKVLKFGRKFSEDSKESDLLRVIFLHLACGISLRTTVAEAKAANIVDIADVTLFHHFRKCEAFFAWCIGELAKENAQYNQSLFNDGRIWKVADGSLVREPGATGSFMRIHYSLNLPGLDTDQVAITDIKTGESLRRFTISPNEVWLVDRGFVRFSSINHVVKNGADILGRFSPAGVALFSPDTEAAFQLLPKLKALKYGEVGDYPVLLKSGDERIYGRVCVMKQTPQITALEQKRATEHARKNNREVAPKTLELCGYLLIFSTLSAQKYSAKFIVDAYQMRWQVEISFKRLKSLLELGQLHKYDPVSIRTYLNGKMLIALLIEKMTRAAETFSP